MSGGAAASRVAGGSWAGRQRRGTHRPRLFAETKGLLVFDRERIDRLNLVDEAVTLGTLPPYAVVEPKQMVATVKIIPFAVPEEAVARCAEIAAEGGKLLRVAAFRSLAVGMIQTRLPGLKESVLDKTRDVTQGRLDALGCSLTSEHRCAHKSAELAPQIKAAIGEVDMLLIHGASAIVDRRDVIPSAIEAAGGTVEHFGMPVDPGNLLLLGHVDASGARFAWRARPRSTGSIVLERLSPGCPSASEIMSMGAAGCCETRGARREDAGAPWPGGAKVRRLRMSLLLAAANRAGWREYQDAGWIDGPWSRARATALSSGGADHRVPGTRPTRRRAGKLPVEQYEP